jgi:transposase
VAIPARSSRWATPGRAWLEALDLPPTPRAIVDDCCGVLDALATPIARLEREIGALANPDPSVQSLMYKPVVGKQTSMTDLAEIGDVGRFPTSRHLCAWAGLTRKVRNSDRKVRHGHITKQGSPWVRWILQEAAHSAKKSPPFIDSTASSPAAGAAVATVAIARRLLARSFHILTQLEAAPAPEKVITGRARVLASACNTAAWADRAARVRTHRHADPTPGPEWGACETSPRRRPGLLVP